MKRIPAVLLLFFCLTTRPASNVPKTTKAELAKLQATLTDIPPRPFATDVILLCIDNGFKNETAFGAISAPLGGALNAKTGIIVTTAGLIHDILSLDKNFRPADWQNFYLTDAPDIYILIPREYKPPRQMDPKLGKDFSLGFHLDRLTPISDQDMASQEFHTRHAGNQKTFSKRFVTALTRLFVTKKEWRAALDRVGKTALKDLYMYAPIYAFYIVGHGAQFRSIDQEIATIQKLTKKEGTKKWKETIRWLNDLKQNRVLYPPDARGTVAGIEIAYFTQLLQLFSKQIATALVFYDTCMGGGWNLEELTTQHSYAFILISGAIMGAELFGFGGPDEFDFAGFVKQLCSYNPIDFRELLSTIYLFADLDAQGQAQKGSNVPLLVLPSQKPVPLDIPGQVVSIGNILAQNRDPQNPLNISTEFAGRYLDKRAAERASKSAEKREVKRKKLYQKWLTEKGLAGIADKPIDPKIYKEWLGQLKTFNEQYPITRAMRAPDKVYPHAIILYTDKIPFPLIFTADPNDRLARPPAIIRMEPLISYTNLMGITAPDFTVKQIVHATLLNFPSLEENRIFEVQKLIARNDIPELGAIETGRPNAQTYYRVLAINQAPQSGLSEKTERSALVVKYVNDMEQGAVKITFKRTKATSPTVGTAKPAKSGGLVKIKLEAEQVSPDDLATEWERFAQRASRLYETTTNVLPTTARVSRGVTITPQPLKSDPALKLAHGLKMLGGN